MKRRASPDSQLLQDIAEVLPTHSYLEEYAEPLRQRGIQTYSDLYTLLRDEQADPDLRKAACWVVITLDKQVDRRRAVPPLLAALQSEDKALHRHAIYALSRLDSRRALQPLLALTTDRQADEDLRATALNSFWRLHDEAMLPELRRIIFDETDSLQVRAQALQWSFALPIADYIDLLSNPSSDIRFWAAYRLGEDFQWCDISVAFEALDRTAAFDHNLPQVWGWHVEREAFFALDHIRFMPYSKFDDEGNYFSHSAALISPCVEYWSLTDVFQGQKQQGRPIQEPPLPDSAQVSPEWLRHELERRWEAISFEPPRPAPNTYLLEWVIPLDDGTLMGGLHRDGYGIVLSSNGPDEALYAFAVWYRGISEADPLYYYDWADPGVRLEAGMTVEALRAAVAGLYNRGAT
ncbi:MAG: HEAT repeat domain-containing protein [Anaerolineae bacterium]|nr:HEAT repeat domain-containing protein [Anaerolineae bacterium]